MNTEDRVRVLIILGSGRSGSTITGRLLGQYQHCFSVGEMVQVWINGFAQNHLCACGTPFHDCSFWKDVRKELEKSCRKDDFSRMKAYSERTLTFRKIPEFTVSNYYTEKLSALYKAIRDISGRKVIIDSSKNFVYALHLSQVKEIDLSIVHLVRDSRAVAYSLLRKKIAYPGTDQYMDTLSPWKSAFHWNLYNYGAAAIKNNLRIKSYRMLRYEDLANNPEPTLQEIARFANIPPQLINFVEGNKALILPCHDIEGNPIRFSHGNLNIELDNEWVSAMRPSDKRLVTLLTYPLLKRFGYIH